MIMTPIHGSIVHIKLRNIDVRNHSRTVEHFLEIGALYWIFAWSHPAKSNVSRWANHEQPIG
jgi:hypothetical protein